jgi:hypothetical protein
VQHEVERQQLPPALAQRVVKFFQLKHRNKQMQDSAAIISQLPPGLRLQVRHVCFFNWAAQLSLVIALAMNKAGQNMLALWLRVCHHCAAASRPPAAGRL